MAKKRNYSVMIRPTRSLTIDDSFREDQGDLEELADSIKAKGILQPITVNVEGKVLAGRRRLRAAEMAGLHEIPVLIRPLTDELDEREIELFENIHRKDLEWQEKINLTARVHELLAEKHGDNWRQADTASLMGKARSAVSDAVEMKKAIEIIPSLGKAKTADQARRQYKRFVEEAVVHQALKEGSAGSAARWADDHYKIGDALTLMRKCEPGAADFAEVDPPYAIDRKAEGYNEIAASDYPKFLTTAAAEVFRCLADNAWCIWWFGPTWQREVLDTLRDAGFKVDDIPAIWYKEDTASPTASPDFYLNRGYEPFFVCRKGQPPIRKRSRSNVFVYPSPRGDRTHTAERPVALIEDIIETFVYPGASILSPFLGSGSTLIAAYRLKCKGWGYELTDSYKRSFLKRVTEEFPDA